MKFNKKLGASVATSVDPVGYKINISGHGVKTYIATHKPSKTRLGKFHDSEQAKQACIDHHEASSVRN